MVMIDAMDIFIQRVREEMAKQGMSQSALAEELKTQQPAISRLLSGRERHVDLSRCERIAQALKVPLVSLLVQAHEKTAQQS